MSKKKSKRRFFIITAASILVLLMVGGGGIALMMGNEQKQMTPLDNSEIIPGIFAVRNGFVNIFLVKSNNGYIAIDAGVNVPQTEEGMEQLGIASDSVSAVLLTHSHGDHTGALKVFNKAKIYAANSSIADKSLADGEIFEVGGLQIQVISTPGHAEDSVCFLIDERFLFVGDNLSLVDGKVGLFNSVYNNSDEKQKKDIQKLAGLSGIEYIFTAHYGFSDKAVFP